MNNLPNLFDHMPYKNINITINDNRQINNNFISSLGIDYIMLMKRLQEMMIEKNQQKVIEANELVKSLNNNVEEVEYEIVEDKFNIEFNDNTIIIKDIINNILLKPNLLKLKRTLYDISLKHNTIYNIKFVDKHNKKYKVQLYSYHKMTKNSFSISSDFQHPEKDKFYHIYKDSILFIERCAPVLSTPYENNVTKKLYVKVKCKNSYGNMFIFKEI
jgi:hypothetical protein